MVAELANGDNSHDPGNFGSDQGSVTGYTVTSNNNINRDAPAKSATAGVQAGGRRKRRRRRTRKKRGGGYGFNPQGTPGFGRMPIKVTNTCGVAKDPNLNTSSQFVGSPPPQRGGYGGADLRGTDLTDQEGSARVASENYGIVASGQTTAPSSQVPGLQSGGSRGAAPCGGCGGTPYYGYTGGVTGITNYPPRNRPMSQAMRG